jgi:hypothetical protein
MVAFTNKSANFPQRPLRVRAQNHRYRLRAAICSNSSSRAKLREATYAESERLESCSKDPFPVVRLLSRIYFEDDYNFVGGRPLIYLDPNGLRKRKVVVNGKVLFECRSKRQNPSYDLNDQNGCTGIGGGPFNFTQPCNNHDLCWNKCGACRDCCDNAFIHDMIDHCDKRYPHGGDTHADCVLAAAVYLEGVRNIGPAVYETTQDDSCEWDLCLTQPGPTLGEFMCGMMIPWWGQPDRMTEPVTEEDREAYDESKKQLLNRLPPSPRVKTRLYSGGFR